jgi:hypothetical protein
MLEFVLIGIPVIFVLISIFEIARGMWTYHTMAYAVREGVRYASVHGKGCASPNTCQVTIGQITSVITLDKIIQFVDNSKAIMVRSRCAN